MTGMLEQLRLTGLVPVIAIQDAELAEPLARALVDGGLPCAEVTFRTAAAEESIRRIARAVPDMLLGAGTVLTIDQAKRAVDAGAKYIVSPGINPKIVEFCVRSSIPITPGVVTPSDVEVALEHGLEVVKFFPAEAAGGLPMLKALSGPYGKVRFIPTGGIDESNLLSYLRFPKTLACGGSWMVKPELIAGKQFTQIRDITARAVQTMLGFAVDAVVIPATDEALSEGAALAGMLHLPVIKGEKLVGIGPSLELQGGLKSGEIAVKTHFLDRAVAYLSRRGFRILELKEGRVVLQQSVAGFSVTIRQR